MFAIFNPEIGRLRFNFLDTRLDLIKVLNTNEKNERNIRANNLLILF